MIITEHTIKIDGSNIYYHTAGDPQKKTLLFLHGWPGIDLVKTGVIQELAKNFYVIAPEHPGLIRSDPLSNYTNIFDQNAEVSYQIVKQEKRDKGKIIVIGQSFGGGVASSFAYKYPINTKQLVLVDSIVGCEIASPWMKFLLIYGPKLLRIFPFLPYPLKKLVFKYVFAAEESKQTNWKILKRSIPKRIVMVEKYVNLVHHYVKQNKAVIDKDYDDFPILFVWGDRDGKEFNIWGSIPVEFAKDLFEKMKQEGRKVKLITVNGGHTILYQKPKYVIKEIMSNL